MPPRVIDAAEFANWLLPRQAQEILTDYSGDVSVAINSIVQRLKNGLVHAVAETAIDYESGVQKARKSLESIDPDEWRRYYKHTIEFWRIGDITFEMGYRYSHSHYAVSYSNVRFEPSGILAMTPKPAPLPGVQVEPQPQVPGEPLDDTPKGPPVSRANLEAWYALYQSVYPETVNTEPHAHKSAQGMFHDKTVTRGVIRTIRGSHKPGPKGGRRN